MNNIQKILSFYMLTNTLKDKIRSGWKIWNVSAERLESVAEHIYGTCMLAIAIDSEFDMDIDIRKVIMMIALHELEEIKIGDLTPFDNITNDEKRKIGSIATRDILNGLVKEDEYYSLIQEFEDKKSNEAIFAKMCDKLEADIQIKIYEEKGYIDINKPENKKNLEDSRIIDLMNNGAKNVSDLYICYDKPGYIWKEFSEIADYIKENKIVMEDNNE